MSPEHHVEGSRSGSTPTGESERLQLLSQATGDPLVLANEFAEVRLIRVETRNGARLLVDSPKSGQWVTLDPLELEALTRQGRATFSAMISDPLGPLVAEDEL